MFGLQNGSDPDVEFWVHQRVVRHCTEAIWQRHEKSRSSVKDDAPVSLVTLDLVHLQRDGRAVVVT